MQLLHNPRNICTQTIHSKKYEKSWNADVNKELFILTIINIRRRSGNENIGEVNDILTRPQRASKSFAMVKGVTV